MLKTILVCLIFPILICNAHASNLNYPVSDIPEPLLKNADAIIRKHTIIKEIASNKKVITHETYVVTIFNKSAQSLGYFNEQYNEFSSVSDYNMELYNKDGILIDKSQTKDFKDVKAYDGYSLFDNNRKIFNNWYSDKYPYTVSIKFTRTDEQTLGLGNWYPVSDYDIAVQVANISISMDEDDNIHFKAVNIPTEVNVAKNKNKISYSWEIKHFKAIKKEPFMPSYENVFPFVRLAANNFNYDGYTGELIDWESFGNWEWNLINGRDELDEATIFKIRELTDTLSNDIEKIEFLYNYLQNNTRYVSIQLGIGGNQPFEAKMVDETKYGDCKALSNYMKALLKTVNIKSDYAIIKAGKNAGYIDTSFTSHQFNHVILCVPNKGDTIWLECTSQEKPFGFLGSFTENRNAFLIKENTCEWARTPEYSQETNTQFSQVYTKLDSFGNCEITSHTNYQALQYENIASYFFQSPKDQKKGLYGIIGIPNTIIQSYSFNHKNKPIPEASMQLQLSIRNYAPLNGERMFVPINPLNAMTYIPEKIKNRKYPIVIKSCGFDADTIKIELPNNYSIEFLPEPIDLTTPYGKYSCKFNVSKNQVIYIRSYKWNKGEFPAEDYSQIRDFFKAVASADNAKIILMKKA